MEPVEGAASSRERSLARLRTGPAIRPMVLSRPVLIPVIDANALLVMGCDWIKRDREQDLLTGMAATGRGTPHIASHIPQELDRHVGRLARVNKVSEAQVRQALDKVILPSSRLVDLEIRDLLSPGARTIRHVDPTLRGDLRGDPDDAPTMALAEFLAPAVIVSQDSVFHRFGFAAAAAKWIPIAKDMLQMVGCEATLADAAVLSELAMRLVGSVLAGAARLAARYPLPAAAALALAVWWCHKQGWLKGRNWRQVADRFWQMAEPLLSQASLALEESNRIRGALITVEPLPNPVPEQIAARYLARCGRALTPAELRDALAVRGTSIPATHLKKAMTAHSAFVRLPGDRYIVGRIPRMTSHAAV